jgi:hypothetical protein
MNQSDNIVAEEVVENNTDEIISHNRVYYHLEDSIVVVEKLENTSGKKFQQDSLNTEMYKDTLEIEPKKEKRNFFQRIFKKRK